MSVSRPYLSSPLRHQRPVRRLPRSLFRERRAQLEGSGGALELTSNFRSRHEILEAVNTVFAERFERFAALVHAREEDAPGRAQQGPADTGRLIGSDGPDPQAEHAVAQRLAP